VFKFLSDNNIVIAPAKTGKESNNKNAVIKTDQTNNGMRKRVIPRILMLHMVTIKFIAPAIEDIPAKCKLKIAKSTDAPECAIGPDNGG